jgi:hypothetical protein
MSSTRQLSGSPAQYVLPTKLSPIVQRELLIQSGREVEVDQLFAVPDLMALSVDDRRRLVEVTENSTVDCHEADPNEIEGPWSLSVTQAWVVRYGELWRGGNKPHWMRSPEPGSARVDEIFFATPGRTTSARAHFEAMLNPDDTVAFRAMLAGAPLVTEAPEGAEIALEHVLDAYEHALRLARAFIQVLDDGVSAASGTEGIDDILFSPISEIDGGIVFEPNLDNEREASAAAILRNASPEAYANAKAVCDQLRAVPTKALSPVVDRMCTHWWQSPWVEKNDAAKFDDLSWGLVNLAKQQAASVHYESERSGWIAVKGSKQLKRAAAREYMHDGIYRDERLALELAGFVSDVGRKPTIRNLVNPSAEALELEDQTLAQARRLGITDDQVRLVWLDPDNGMPAGEYLRIERYLGRHTVWRAVDPESEGNDIPL